MPVATTRIAPTAPRPVTSSPPGRAASSVRQAAASRAADSIAGRVAVVPCSSSGTTSSRSAPRPGGRAAATRPRACTASATHAFMSPTPGPESSSPFERNGHSATVPIGHTVSEWPSTRTVGPSPMRHLASTSGPCPSTASIATIAPSALAASARSSPIGAMPLGASVGLSISTSRRVSATIASSRASVPPRSAASTAQQWSRGMRNAWARERTGGRPRRRRGSPRRGSPRGRPTCVRASRSASATRTAADADRALASTVAESGSPSTDGEAHRVAVAVLDAVRVALGAGQRPRHHDGVPPETASRAISQRGLRSASHSTASRSDSSGCSNGAPGRVPGAGCAPAARGGCPRRSSAISTGSGDGQTQGQYDVEAASRSRCPAGTSRRSP